MYHTEILIKEIASSWWVPVERGQKTPELTAAAALAPIKPIQSSAQRPHEHFPAERAGRRGQRLQKVKPKCLMMDAPKCESKWEILDDSHLV